MGRRPGTGRCASCVRCPKSSYFCPLGQIRESADEWMKFSGVRERTVCFRQLACGFIFCKRMVCVDFVAWFHSGLQNALFLTKYPDIVILFALLPADPAAARVTFWTITQRLSIRLWDDFTICEIMRICRKVFARFTFIFSFVHGNRYFLQKIITWR